MFNRVPGLSPASERQSRRVRSKARSAPAAYEKNFRSTPHQILPLEPGGVRAASCSPPAWPRGAATSRGGGDDGGVQAAGDFKASHLRHQLFRRDHVWQ